MKLMEIDGLPVQPAKRAVILTVTERDIAKAHRREPDFCAVAFACKRELKAKEVRIHTSRVYIRLNENNWLRYVTPSSMRAEIIAYDRGGKFVGGEFQLGAPSSAKRTGKRQGSKTWTKGGGKKRRPRHVITDIRASAGN